ALEKAFVNGRPSCASELSPECPRPLEDNRGPNLQGTIKKVVRDRGFGFIHANDGREIFFHRSSLQQLDFDSLKEGQNVDFDVERAEKGPRAINVRAGPEITAP